MANGDGGNPPMTPEQLDALITRMSVLNDAMADQKVTAEEVLVIQDDRLEALKEELKQNGLALESKTAQLELQKEAFKLQREDIQAAAHARPRDPPGHAQSVRRTGVRAASYASRAGVG